MIKKNRIISKYINTSEDFQNYKIRPNCLKDYIGQVQVCEQMKIFIDAAKVRKEPLDHTLIFGPPGLGKTTLANVIANEMKVNINSTSGPILEKAGDIASLLTRLETKDILFIDEIHRLSPAMEEILYPAMEECQIDIIVGEGITSRSIKIDISPFTLIGVTTRAGLLTSPLRDRFGIIQRLDFYNVADLTNIIIRSACLLKLVTDTIGASEIAKRARGTPRIANRLLRRVRDYAQVKADGSVNKAIANEALNMLKIDSAGFDHMDRYLLQTILKKFDGGPVGIESLAASIGEERGTIEEILEPYLIQQGYIIRTSRGRMATKLSYHHFGIAYKA